MRCTPWLLLLLAAALRVAACVRTPTPGRDGATYLWLAQQWQHGDLDALFTSVFHPLYPFLTGCALRLFPNLDVVVAGQLISAGCATLAVVPLWSVTRRAFGERAALWTGLLYAIGSWFVRHPAECMSEGPFYLLTALWASWLWRTTPRPLLESLLAGIAAGLAFLVRPEGAALAATAALHLWATGRRTTAALHLLSASAVCAALPVGAWICGQGFMLTPKAAFNWNVGAGGADSSLGHYLQHWLRLPGDACEGLGYLLFPLMVAGAWCHRPRSLRDPSLLLVLPFVLQWAVIPLLKSHHRFVSGFGVLLLPYAGALLPSLLTWLQHKRHWLPALAIFVLLGSEARWWLNTTTDRTIERDLGRELGAHLQPHETLATDMPRLQFFAGRQPPPPEVIPATLILEVARQPGCRFVVLKRGRTELDRSELLRLGLQRLSLPSALRDHPAAADIEVFVRPR